MADIGGFDCTNSLIRDFSRLVFEAKKITKLAFENIKDLLHFYKLIDPSSGAKDATPEFYEPNVANGGEVFSVRTPFGQVP